MLTPLCVWFYFGCAGSRPAIGSEDRDAARRMEEIAGHIHEHEHETAQDTTSIPVRDTVIASAVEIAVPEPAADSTTLPAITEERAQELLDSAAMKEQALRALQAKYVQLVAGMHKGQGEVSPDSVRAAALEEILPLVDSLRALGIELPAADTTMTADEDMLRRVMDMVSAGRADIEQARAEAVGQALGVDSIPAVPDTLPRVRPARKPFLDAPLFATAKDSMVYDVLNDTVWLYREANIDYQDLNFTKADIFSVNTVTKIIDAHGIPNDSGTISRPVFTQGGQPMDMKIVAFNLDSKVGIVRDFAMQEGEGYMNADLVKIHPDRHFDMAEGRYTTCNHTDHPHFYIRMTKGKVIPNSKVIFGMAHFVLEDVPLYFPFIPFGFFPLATGPSSGFIMPTFGEEYSKGFFIRDGGYYFRFGEYADASVRGSIYTLGSWDASITSSYIKRYKFSGSLNVMFSKDIVGEKGSADYINGNSLSITWNHRQDPKARPNSTFSADVRYSTGNKKYSSKTINDYIASTTESSIAYAKTFPASGSFPGGSINMAMRVSRTAQDSSVTAQFPQASWRINNFKPFKNKNRRGKEKWYEKITLSYSGSMNASMDKVKESEIFKQETLDKIRTGVAHKIPISASFTLGGYINVTLGGNFNSNWLFKKQDLRWDEINKTVVGDTTSGFFATYEYSANMSVNTKIYGMYEFKNKEGLFRAIRHTITPSASISIKPNFGKPQYGFWRTYQTNESGATTTYSPYSAVNLYGSPGRGESATMSFTLQQNLEAKVRSKRDTTGMRKISIIENLSLSSSLNLMADSMQLAPIGFTLSIPIIKQFKLSLNGSLHPYQLDDETKRPYNRFTFADGKLPRLTNLSTGFNWNWAPTFGSQESIEQFERAAADLPHDHEIEGPIDHATRRALLAATYYDFSLPFNFGFSYSMRYANDQRQRQLTHSINFNGSLTLTPYKADGQSRWAVTLPTIGYDFTNKKLTPGAIAIVRDLHCFTMSFNWIPVGPRSWSFNIRVKSSVLQDIKYDKNRSYYDTLYN